MHSASSAMGFKEALNFLQSTLEADGVSETTCSPRIVGLCHSMALTKKPLKQARVLTVRQVVLLESIVMSEGMFLPDRVFAGHTLACIHGRLRWSDSQRLLNLEFDVPESHPQEGFLNAVSLDTKTATTVQKKTTFLPHVILTGGISTCGWAQKWMELRASAGLVVGVDMPIMPVVGCDGEFSKCVELSSDKAGKWLVELLKSGGESALDTEGVSSHSLKAVGLSWAAKHGSMDETARAKLGYHVGPNSSSMLHYSRDELSGPLRQLQTVYADIIEGEFWPDVSRSGYVNRIRKSDKLEPSLPALMTPKPKARASASAAMPEPSEYDSVEVCRIGVEVDDDSELLALVPSQPVLPEELESDTSGSDGSTDSDALDEALSMAHSTTVPTVVAKFSAADYHGAELFLHSIWCTLHRAHETDVSKLACGRAKHAGFKRMDPASGVIRAQCTVCFPKSSA